MTPMVFLWDSVAKATLQAINDKLKFNHFSTYPDISGIIKLIIRK